MWQLLKDMKIPISSVESRLVRSKMYGQGGERYGEGLSLRNDDENLIGLHRVNFLSGW